MNAYILRSQPATVHRVVPAQCIQYVDALCSLDHVRRLSFGHLPSRYICIARERRRAGHPGGPEGRAMCVHGKAESRFKAMVLTSFSCFWMFLQRCISGPIEIFHGN